MENQNNRTKMSFIYTFSVVENLIYFYIQIWCGGARPESYIGTLRSGKHSPGRFR